MALVIPPNCAQIALHFSLPGQAGDVISTFAVETLPDLDWQETVEDAVTPFTVNVLPLLASVVQLVEATYVANPGGPLIGGVVPVATFGTNAAAPLPPNCTWLIRKNSNLIGRTNRGRMYLPGLVEPNVTAAGTIDLGQVTDMNAGLADWLAAVQASVGAFVILHDDGGAGALADPAPVTSLICQEKIATQRGRLRD